MVYFGHQSGAGGTAQDRRIWRYTTNRRLFMHRYAYFSLFLIGALTVDGCRINAPSARGHATLEIA